MKTFEANKDVWDRLYKSGLKMEYPKEELVRRVHHLFRNMQGKKVLDLGFGCGSNLIYLLKSGFEGYGCDISPAALELAQKRLKELRLPADLKLFMDVIPYPNEFFDIVVSWQTLYYNDPETLKSMIKEISRVLKPGGKILVTLARKNDIIFECADKIDNKTYRVNSKMPSQEGAIVYVVDNEDEIKQLFSGFKILEIGYFESKFAGMVSSHWVVYGEKP
jgi:ubiquinone/menaquinone biosynthesis C-methylase UbiE